MENAHAKQGRVCQICGSDRLSDLERGIQVSPAVIKLIQKEIGSWSEEGWICADDLRKFRHKYFQSLLDAEKGELTALEKEVLESLSAHEILARNPDQELQSSLTFGQRLAEAGISERKSDGTVCAVLPAYREGKML